MDDETWQVPVTRGAVRLRDGRLIGARTEHSGGAASVLASESRDDGKTWTALSTIAEARVPDLGDGGFLDSRKHGLLYALRKNRPPKDFAIEVFQSRNGGKTWTPHSTVTSHALTETGGPSRGLWAPTLAETPGGRLLCVYDDENFPLLHGFPGHQWLMGRLERAGGRQPRPRPEAPLPRRHGDDCPRRQKSPLRFRERGRQPATREPGTLRHLR
jgi:hypothetical protein